MPWDFFVILVVLAVVVPSRGAARIRKLLAQPDLSSADRLALYASTIAFQWLAAGVVLWRALARHLDIEQMALTVGRPPLTITITVVLSLLVLFNQIVGIRRLSRVPPTERGFMGELAAKIMPRGMVEQLVFVPLVATVSICEEFVYRGFIQLVFQNLSRGSIIVGIAASAVFFAVAHLYQGKRGVATTLVIGILFSGLRAWTGSLLPMMAAHFVADFCAGLVAPRLMNRAQAS